MHVCVFEAEGKRKKEGEKKKNTIVWRQFLCLSVTVRPCEHVHAEEHFNCHQNLILLLNSKQNQVEPMHTAGVSERGSVCVCVRESMYVTATPLW